MTIRDELLALTDPEDDRIYPESVVAWAQRNPGSELHPEFEWDDRKAAHEHRLFQARRLIQLHVVFEETGKRSVVSLVPDRPRGGGYRPLGPVLNNADLRVALLRQILDEMLRVLTRYPQLDELTALRQTVEAQQRMLEMQSMLLAAD
jgi:hypothetical protein